MNPTQKEKYFETWKRFARWVNRHQSLVRLIILTIGLTLFLIFLPAPIRIALWDSLLSHKMLTGMLFVFSLLAISLIWTTGQQIDAWFFLLFNLRGRHPVWLDRLMLGFTQIGSAGGALAVGLVLYFSRRHLLAYEFILGSLILWLSVELMKFLFHRARPIFLMTQARIVGNRALGRSFPSGHTSQAFFMATFLAQAFHFNIWIVFLLYSIALFVGITRMYVGAHYPRDMVAGAILGSAWGLLGVIVTGYVLNKLG